MKFCLPTKKKINNCFQDTLVKNTFYIMLTSITSALFGFLFWWLAAKYYSAEEVGIGTALLSSLYLLILISRFGVDQSIIRFSPENDKNKIFSMAVIITTFFVIFFGIIFIVGINLWSPELQILKKYSILYLLLLVSNSTTALIGTFFIALRKSNYYFYQNLLINLRVILIVILASFGTLGILISIGMPLIIAAIVSILIVYKLGIKLINVGSNHYKDYFNYAIKSYLVDFFTMAPANILPILILNKLGAENAACYYIAYSVTSLLFIIPSSFKMSLFVEGSHGEDIKRNTVKSFLLMYSLLIPSILFLDFFGPNILRFYGEAYVQGAYLLKQMAFSSIFYSIFQIYISIKNVEKKLEELLYISILSFILIIGLSYFFVVEFGLIGVGYAWVLCYCIISFVLIFISRKGFVETLTGIISSLKNLPIFE